MKAKKIQILMISSVNPYPPVSGGQRRCLDEIKVLSRFAEIDLLTFYDETEKEVPEQLRTHLAPFCREIVPIPVPLKFNRHRVRQMMQFVRASLSPYPFRFQKLWVPPMIQAFQQRIRDRHYDVIHFNHLATARFVELVPENYPAAKIATEANVEWEIFARYAENFRDPVRRLLFAREAKRLKHFEISYLNRMNGVVVLSERDAELLRQKGMHRPMHIFRRPMQVATPPKVRFEDAEPLVISLGRLEETRTHGTLWFANEVWDKVLARCPQARWHIIGADPPAAIQSLHGKRNIVVEGFVEDLDPILYRTRACVIPLFIGGGIRIKILDMLAAGIPCVSTTVGAQGLENEGVLITDEPDKFADAVVSVLTDRELWYRMQSAGQAFIRARYSTESVEQAVWEFVNQVIRSREP